ncbi:MAG: Caspase (Peptidase) [uncultured Sulfurovum sp.]|uniref:Caspase (Peptidase) n=1 Tax=uncultured Sulfurovum sp. TaxID=269237 RepID=A0A6S6SEQ0_9BACT|nr:MAG: Caspase (Peptidase) [uncultured Sulfurovum sp.]
MRFIILTLLLSLSLLAKEKVALVIGNKNYTNQTGLKNPIRDAELLRDTLDDLGFRVIEVYDANVDTISDKLAEFASQASRAKVAVVYYAGHGVGVDGKNYLIPLQATNLSRATLPKKLISLDELKEAVSSSQGFGVVFFDACRNSFFSGQIRGLSANRSSRALVQPQANSKNILVSFSTQAGQLAKDDVNNGRHSPYALALSEKLKLKKDIRLVMGGVKERVEVLSSYAQEPISRSSLGEDVFCLTNGCEQVKVVEKIVYRDRVVEPTVIPKREPKPITATSTSKWLKPTNSVCKANGGKIYKGVCQANWENAKKICSQSRARLPSKNDLHKVIKDCGGIADANSDEWGKNYNNSSYQSCYKQKGFSTNDWYWTRETYEQDSSYAWIVHFYRGRDDWHGKAGNGYALCVR